MEPNQRHHSDPFVCYDNLLITESTVCFRRGSASLLEMLQCRKHSLTNAMNPSLCLYPSQDLASTKSRVISAHATDYQCCNSAQNQSLLSPHLSSHQQSHHDSASHFNSSLLPNNLQPPSEHRLSVTRSPQAHHHCKACMSVLLRDRTKGGGSLGHTQMRSFSTSTQITPVSEPCTPTSPYLSRSPSVTLSPLFVSSPSSNSQTKLLTSPLRLSSPSQVVLPGSLYEGGDLTLLNHCLHHIVSRRTSSPTLTERGTNYPLHRHGEVGNTTSSEVEHIDKSQSLDVPLFCSPYLDRKLQLLPNDSKGRPDPLVG